MQPIPNLLSALIPFLLGIFILTLPKQLKAQEFDLRKAQLDSLMSVPASGDPSIDADRFNNIAWEWRYYSTDSALHWAYKAYDLAKEIPLRKRQAANTLGAIYRMRSEADTALQYYQLAYDLAYQNADTTDMARYLNNQSLVYKDIGQLADAASLLNRAMELRRAIADSNGYFGSMINMAVLNKSMGKTQEAINYYQTAASYYRRAKVPLRAIIADINTSLAYESLNDMEQAIFYIERAFRDMQKNNLMQYEGVARNVRGDFYVKTAQWKRALEDLEYGYQLNQQSGEVVKILESGVSLGRAYWHLNRLAEVKTILRSMESLLSDHPNLWEQQIDVASLKMDVAEKEGSWKNAFVTATELLTFSDSLQKRSNRKAFAKEREAFDTALKEEQIARQQIELDLAKQRIQNQRLWIAILGLFILFGGIFILLWRRSTQQKQQLDLQKMDLEKRSIELQAIVQTQETERQRMARDLHDGVVQQITVLLMQGREEGSNLVDPLTDLATEVRALSHEIMPRALQEHMLAEAVEQMANRSFKKSGIQLEAFYSVPDPHRLSDDLSLSVYRIAQEMVQNVIKHANATKVELNMVVNAERLMLSFSDNGKGADLSNIRYGLGLQNMDARARLIGGRIDFKSNEDSGLEVLLWIPKPYGASFKSAQISEKELSI